MEKQQSEIDKPPYFEKWSSLYWLVGGFLGLMIVLFLLFTFYFS